MESALAGRGLIIAFTLFLFVILPSGMLLWLGRWRANDRTTLLLMVTLVTCFFGLYYANHPGWYHLSGHLRWLLFAAYLFALASVVKRAVSLRWRPQLKPLHKALNFVVIVVLALTFAAGLIAYRIEVASAGVYQGKPLALRFPLQHAHASVMHGGSSILWNHHVVVPGQRYALDIVVLDPVWGRRARGSPAA